jgi:hypothetical protein
MLALQLTVAAAGRILILSSQAQAPVTSEILSNSAYLSLFLDGETFSSTADSRIFFDSSDNNFTVTNSVGGVRRVVQTSFNPYGQVGLWSEYFEEAADYVSPFTTSSGFTFLHTPTAKFTIEGWIFPLVRGANASTAQVILDDKNNSDTGLGITLSILANKLKLTIGNGGATVCTAQSISDIPLRWTHIAVTYDQTTATDNAKIYIDGVLDSTTSKSAASATTTNASSVLYIGNNTGRTRRFSPGYISNLRICNSVVYDTNFTPSTTALTAISGTQLLVFQDGVLKDSSPNNYKLQVSGAQAARFSPFGVPVQTSSTVGSAYFRTFSGNPQALRLQPNDAFVFGTGDFTVECWVYPFLSGENVLFNSYNSVPQIGFLLDAAKPALWDGTAKRTSSQNVENFHWSHVAWVRSSNVFKIYVNGKATTTTSHSINFASTTTEYFIGRRDNAALAPYQGYISDFRIVKGTAVYNGDFTPPNSPLSALTGTSLLLKFNNLSVTDKTGGMYPVYLEATTTNAGGIVTSVKKNGTSSIYLNGQGSSYVTVLNNQFQSNYKTFDYGRADFTIEFWVNFQTFTANTLLYSRDNGNATDGILIGVNAAATATNLAVSSNGSSFFASNIILSPGSTTGTWRHMAFTRSDGTFRTFSNGTLVSTFTSTSAIFESANNPIRIGGRGGSTNITGYIDDFRIYRGYAKYTSNFTPE